MIGPSPRAQPFREDGAVALLVALVSLLLLATGALAVDLGNAFARKRLVQTEVDLATLAGGAELPAADAASKATAVAAVLDYLQRNATFGQDESTWTVGQLQDTDTANGEVVFDSANRMRVTAPPATVDFGLAGALGFSSVGVSAVAAAEIRSPGVLMPMWLPASCGVGAVLGDTGPSGAGDPSPETANPTPKDNQLGLSSVIPTTAAYGASVTLTATLTKLPPNVTTADILFTYGTSTQVNYPVPAFTRTTRSNNNRTVSITVDSRVTNTAATWQMWARAKDGYAQTSVDFTVEGAGTLECSSSQRGNFGQLDSPRINGGTKQTRYALNLAIGVDHSFVVHPTPSSNGGECTSSAPSELDNAPARDGRNCVNADEGNDGPGLTEGLLAGVSGYPGRLANNSGGSCGRTPIVFDKVASTPLNNDVLSCFLPTGYTNASIASGIGPTTPQGVLSQAIFDSPRFVWVPVVGCADRSCKGDLAIKSFASCFITDEGLASSKAATDATSSNGITLNNGDTQVSSVQLMCFDPAALPETTTSASGGMPYLGSGTRIVSLVE